jgi:LPS-assembly lipoprotein
MAIRRLIIVWLILLVSSCGFHLRGTVLLPENMTATYVDAPANSLLRYELEGMLTTAGGTVASERGENIALLMLHSEKISSRVLMVDTQGRATRQSYTLLVYYSMLDGTERVVADNDLVRITRDLSVDPDNVLARSDDEARLYDEMRRLAAQQILRRLRVRGRTLDQKPVTEQ